MPTKKASGKAGAKKTMAVRDISSKKPTLKRTPAAKAEQSFTVNRIEQEEGPSVEPLLDDFSMDSMDVEVRKIEPEPVLASPIVSAAPRMTVTHVEEDNEPEMPSFKPIDFDTVVPRDTIKVKFGKFVQLVSNHDFGDVIDQHADEEILMSSNLLTELAGSHDKREERKIPLVFLVGIAIGVVLTYIFFSQ